jgi:hypothetical protein
VKQILPNTSMKGIQTNVICRTGKILLIYCNKNMVCNLPEYSQSQYTSICHQNLFLFLNSSFEKDKQHAMMVHTYTRRKVKPPPLLFQPPGEINLQYPLDKTLHGAQTHSGLGEIFQMQLLSTEPQ